jgi:ketosteroid isomerase-like protein
MKNTERARELLQLAGAMRIEELLDRLADAAVLELPFAPGGMPRTVVGKAAIREFLLDTRTRFCAFSMSIDSVHETSDPNVVIAEHRSEGVVAANARTYRNRYVTVYRFDAAGCVMNWREYFDSGVVVRAFAPEPQSAV